MGLRAFREIPKNLVEWGKFFQSLVITADEVPPEAIEDHSLGYQKIQIVTPDRLLGRDTSPAGVVQELTVSGGLEFTGSGIQRSAITGDVTIAAGGTVATLRTLVDADIPVAIARDSEVSAAVAAHEAAGNHAQYVLITSVSSNVYTPTLTNVTNLDSSAAYVCQYLRVGPTCTVSGAVDMNPTAAADTQLEMSLPFASNFSAIQQCAGTASCPSLQQSAAVYGSIANDRAVFRFTAADATDRQWFFSFTYQII